MATTQIPLLPTATTADDADNLLIRQGSVDKKVTRSVFLSDLHSKHDELLGGLVTTGAAGAYLLSTTRGLTTNTAPEAFTIKLNHSSSGACTLTVDSAPTLALVDGEGNAIIGDKLQSGSVYTVVYDGTSWMAINSTWDATETREGLASIATQSETDTGTDDVTYVTPLKLQNWVKDADETTKGLVERATQAEVDAQTDTSRYVTPATLASLGITGSLTMMASTIVPAGYLECNGAEISRVTYANLFSAIGTSWGAGDGSTTFNIPDLRGEFVRGWDNGKGTDSGRSVGSYQEDELESHTHELLIGQDGGANSDGLVNTGWNIKGNFNADYSGSNNVKSTGGSETRPRNMCVMYCIRT